MNKVTSLVFYKMMLVGVGLLSLVGVGFAPMLANVSAHPLLQSAVATSSKSGQWSDPQVWSSGVIPQPGEAVVIRKGDKVVYDVVSDAVLDQVTIDGELYFSREVNTRLKVKNHILVQAGGYLNMGTPTDYLPPNIKAELTFVLTEAQANAFTGTDSNQSGGHRHEGGSNFESPDIGLWVFEKGRWDVHGAPLMRTWSKLAGDAPAGASTLTVENQVDDWYAGGQVVVTSTRNPTTYYIRESDKREMSKTTVEHEMRTIQAVELLDNGQTKLTLDRPLSFTHSGTAPFRGEVALLTRNVVVSTEIVGVNNFSDVRTRKFAHTMYMSGAKGDLQYGEFKRLGHYGIRARYAVHHHRMLGTAQGMVVRGNAMWETGFRCVNLHISSGVLVEDNVCYDSASTAFFVEEDERQEDTGRGYHRGYNQDNVFVHNIAIAPKPKHFDDRNNDTIGGDSRRAAAFWPGSETRNEAYLGNVAVGGYEYGDSAGFVFPENGNEINSKGGIPFTFVHNEVHSSAIHGIFSWQNVSVERDMVDTLLWRNGNAGIRWGAYRTPAFYFNTQLLENGRSALEITSINAFLQDSTIVGSTADGSKQDWGFAITGYVIPQYPNPGAWVVRNTFKDLQTSGVSQLQHPIAYDNVAGNECDTHNYDSNQPYDLKQRPVQPGECSGIYITLMGNQFENVARPLVFGKAANPNSWWKVFDYTRDGLPADDFVAVRSDQNQSDKQGVITKKLVTGQAQYNADLDALVVPMASLDPAGVQLGGLLNHRPSKEQNRSPSPDFTFRTQPDYPPTVTLEVTTVGESVTMKATAADDIGVSRIEFFVDWTKVKTEQPPAGTTATGPYEVTVDLSNHPRKYAYLYVRVFDGTQQFGSYAQRAYSQVIEIGPETLGPIPAGSSGTIDSPVDLNESLFLPMLRGNNQ